MSPSKLYNPHDVVTDILYHLPGGATHANESAKQFYLGDRDEHTRRMTIHDIRNCENSFDLDTNGFQYVKLAAKKRDGIDEETIKTEYYKEMEEEIKKVTGASTVHIFNHLVRQAVKSKDQLNDDEKDPKALGPAGQPHVDFTGVPEYLEALIGPSGYLGIYSDLFTTSSRWQIIGAWRPLKTIVRDPLAVADATTVPDSDFSVRTRVYPNGMTGANAMLGHESTEDQHRWYYLHEQQPDELLFLKHHDSKQDLPGWRCAHSAFQIPSTAHLPPRESIEIRAVTFF